MPETYEQQDTSPSFKRKATVWIVGISAVVLAGVGSSAYAEYSQSAQSATSVTATPLPTENCTSLGSTSGETTPSTSTTITTEPEAAATGSSPVSTTVRIVIEPAIGLQVNAEDVPNAFITNFKTATTEIGCNDSYEVYNSDSTQNGRPATIGEVDSFLSLMNEQPNQSVLAEGTTIGEWHTISLK